MLACTQSGSTCPLQDRPSSFPRTLIVSEAPFGGDNGFGVTLTTFFQGWPKPAVVQLYSGGAAHPAQDVCRSMLRVDVSPVWSRRHAVAFWLGRRACWHGKYSPRWLRRSLKDFRPEVIYAFVFSGHLLAFAAWAAERVGCPLVVHVGDDGLEGSRPAHSQSVESLLARSRSRLVISEEMRTEYERRYGLDFAVLHNGAAVELLRQPRPLPDRNGPFVIRYLGSLVPEFHGNAIEDIAAAVRRLAENGLFVRFEICGGPWTRAEAEKLADGRSVVYRAGGSRSEGYRLLQSADLLVVPFNFASAPGAPARLSLPTKLTEYLGSGTPTLVYGPTACGPVGFCRRHGVGSVLTERSIEKLAEFIARVMGGGPEVSTKAANDREFILRNFSAESARLRLRTVLAEAASAAVGAPRS